MKQILSIIVALSFFSVGHAQITITAADMPVAGDTLCYTYADPLSAAIHPADSGAGLYWGYPLTPLSPFRQGIDTYQTALSVNIFYAALIGPTAIGYKVADSFPLPPIPGIPPIQQIYTFFEHKTNAPLGDRYQAQAFAANIGGLPTPINYTKPDVWYFFPLNYSNQDSANYVLNITLPTFGGIKQSGTRMTRVDGWGTITTPYYTTAVNCIRVKSVIHEIDSISFSPLPTIGIPRNTIEYKWLVNGDHYPALWVTSTLLPGGVENIATIRYRDSRRIPADTTSSVPVVNNAIKVIKAVPNPAVNGIVRLELPPGWNVFDVAVFDMSSRLVGTFKNEKELDLSTLPEGAYLAQIVSGANVGYARLAK
jgi:hypothetical protein